METKPGSAGAPIILLTDIGGSDPYSGQIKTVIAALSPDTAVIDLCHDVPAHNVLVGSMFLKGSWKFSPPGSIHLAVVEKGAEGAARPLAIMAHDRYFVGPDNGILWPIVRDAENWKGVVVENPDMMLEEVHATFHSRDIYAPIAAHLANGVPIEKMGNPINDIVKLDKPVPEMVDHRIHGRIIFIDHFGNAWTNITSKYLTEHGWLDRPGDIIVNVASCKVKGLRKSYVTESLNKPIAIINSFDLVEIAWPGESAEKKMRLWEGVWVDMILSGK